MGLPPIRNLVRTVAGARDGGGGGGEGGGPGQSLSVWGRTWHFPHWQSLRGVSTNLENLAARRRFWDLAPRPRFTSFPVSTKLPDPRTRPQPSIGPCWICRDGLRTRGIHRRVEKVPFSLESNVSENLHQNFFFSSFLFTNKNNTTISAMLFKWDQNTMQEFILQGGEGELAKSMGKNFLVALAIDLQEN